MPEVLLGERRSSRPTGDPDSLARLAARFLWAVGAIVVIGVGVDLFTLWVLQRQTTVGWEFVALGATTNSYPMLMLGAAMFYVALALGRSSSVRAYRGTAGFVVLLGLMGLAVCALLVMNYFALKGATKLGPGMVPMFRGVMVKSGALSLIFGAVMLALGIFGFRMPQGRST